MGWRSPGISHVYKAARERSSGRRDQLFLANRLQQVMGSDSSARLRTVFFLLLLLPGRVIHWTAVYFAISRCLPPPHSLERHRRSKIRGVGMFASISYIITGCGDENTGLTCGGIKHLLSSETP